MKVSSYLILLALLMLPVLLYGQAYQGPALGSVPSGAAVSTDTYLRTAPLDKPEEKHIRNKINHEEEAIFLDIQAPPEGSNYYEDPSLTGAQNRGVGQTVLLKSFTGIPETNSIPPDPYVAAGPEHIMAVVNSRFAIWDKEGNLIKTINADTWFSNVLTSPSSFDPKVLYDHFAKRWIMVWLHQDDGTQKAYFLVSVSDDSIPTGTWYNWSLPSNQNGSTVVSNWGDYQGVGFDEDALYITANQFQFGGSFQYVKIRVVPKAQLLRNDAGAVDWQDIWDIRYPTSSGKPFNIRPSVSYGGADGFYLLHAPSGGNFMSVYRIKNATTTPVLTGFNVPVTLYNNAPNANQLGGSTTLIEGGGSAIRNEPKFRDGFFYAVHSVANPQSPAYSNVRYVKINLATQTTVEDVSFGAAGYWHIYDAIDVDKDHNIAITFSRSGTAEYAGSYYTTRLADDPPGLNPSSLLQPGKGNYVKTYSGTRNRWGDYNGIAVDPTDQNNFWIFSEHVAATNTWGTWTGMIRLVPFPGIYVYPQEPMTEFAKVEASVGSDTVDAIISNYGTDALTINAIADSVGPFYLGSQLSFPITLQSYDSLVFPVIFRPSTDGLCDTILQVNSNAPNFDGVRLVGYGFKVFAAFDDKIYGSTGNGNSGAVISVDIQSGSAAPLGMPSNYFVITSLAIHPVTKMMYGLISNEQGSQIVRVNGKLGDAYPVTTFSTPDLVSMAYDTLGTLVAADKNGKLFTIDIEQSLATELVDAGTPLSGIAFNPLNNELWASLYAVFGTNRDKIVKINILTGDTTYIGKTNQTLVTNDIAFDKQGNLYGAVGSATNPNNFISIDQETGAGTVIGSTGIKNITGLVITPGVATGIDEQPATLLPTEFSLKQNYPNPFNPTTTIEFALPIASNVKVTIYNIVGEAVAILINSNMNAGYHRTIWNAKDGNGSRISSGVYFYEVKANGSDGREFSQMKKMILLK